MFEKIAYTWVDKVIKKARTRNLSFTDLGGVQYHELIYTRMKEVEAIYRNQKKKNIFLAIVWAFKTEY